MAIKIFQIDEAAYAFVDDDGSVDLVTIDEDAYDIDESSIVLVTNWTEVNPNSDEYSMTQELEDAALDSNWNPDALDTGFIEEIDMDSIKNKQDAIEALTTVDLI